jgi:hypothetical protein
MVVAMDADFNGRSGRFDGRTDGASTLSHTYGGLTVALRSPAVLHAPTKLHERRPPSRRTAHKLEAGRWMRDVECGMQDAGCEMHRSE